jgi:hypothetical protein
MAVARNNAKTDCKPIKLDDCELVVGDAVWRWGEDNAAAVKRFWKKALIEKPAMFNGDVFLLGDHCVEEGRLTGEVIKTDFASFLYWKDKGLPADAGVRNVFGCAVVRSNEGHLLFGHMGPHTAASGRVYPMAGTPDFEDISDGKLDIEGSISRELMEEAGLRAKDAVRQPGFLLIEDGGMVALCAVFDINAASRDLKARMMQYIDMQDEPELDEIIVFRRAAFHVHHRMPGFARILVQHLLD